MAATDSGPPKAAKAKPNHPTFLAMAKEAVTELADKDGSSVNKIQTYIAGKYNLDTDSVRIYLKPAMAKGLENGTFARPKKSDSKGFSGRFKLNKEQQAKEAKAVKEKEKEKAKKEKEKAKKDTEKVKKPTTKARSASKSPTKKVVKKTATKTAAKKSPKKGAKAKTAKPKATATTKTKDDAAKKAKTVKAALKTPKKTPKATKKAKTPKSAK